MKFWRAFRNFVAKKTKNFPGLQKCWSYNFLNKFIFFIKNDSLATDNAMLTTVANNFLWESTHLQLRFRKPRKKKFELFERKITFLEMFLCTCIKVVVTTLPKFSRQILKNFCWISRNEEKLIRLSKNFFVKNFVWTCATIFWQACRNHAFKSTKDLFAQSLKMIAMRNLRKEVIFPSFLFFKN